VASSIATTEYTAHRDGDGSLEDMWRYAQDAADMDWLGNGDHDNGFGHQYPWWITQKTMDIYHNPPWFIAPYTYERKRRVAQRTPQRDLYSAWYSHVAPWRYARRRKVRHPDTKMLYAYLKHFTACGASHTSATGMGTDWRDTIRGLSLFVEIYQGDRNNYECEGAPRGLTAQRHRGGPSGK